MKKTKLGKKATIEMFDVWAEYFFFILLIMGFFVALIAGSAAISYIVVFLCGMMAGRLIYQKKEKVIFPYYLILVGFLIGYILGSRFGNKSVLITLFLAGSFISYYIHEKGILHDLPF